MDVAVGLQPAPRREVRACSSQFPWVGGQTSSTTGTRVALLTGAWAANDTGIKTKLHCGDAMHATGLEEEEKDSKHWTKQSRMSISVAEGPAPVSGVVPNSIWTLHASSCMIPRQNSRIVPVSGSGE